MLPENKEDKLFDRISWGLFWLSIFLIIVIIIRNRGALVELLF